MKFVTYEHRHALTILNSKDYLYIWGEIKNVISGITEEEIIEEFLSKGTKRGKSISKSLNSIIKARLIEKDWQSESPIFKEKAYHLSYSLGHKPLPPKLPAQHKA